MTPCDVCILMHGDFTEKNTQHCPLCDAMLCADCRQRWDLRSIAAMKRIAQDALASLGMLEGSA